MSLLEQEQEQQQDMTLALCLTGFCSAEAGKNSEFKMFRFTRDCKDFRSLQRSTIKPCLKDSVKHLFWTLKEIISTLYF